MRPEESRVLVVAPLGQDAKAMAGMLRGEGLMAEACAGAEECLARLEDGAGAVLLTEEALELPGAEALLENFGRQPAWSELPLIILTSGGESRSERLLEIATEMAGAVTLLERPMRAGTLLHSVQVALRSRRRQYEVRDLLAERERAAEVLRESEARLQADVAALTRMHELSRRVLEAGGLQRLLQDVMDAAVAIMGAERGTLQLLEGESLRIVAHHGHERPFLEFFAAAENQASVCGEATKRGERVVVPDVEASTLFAGTPSLGVLRRAGVRAMESTPLMSRGGRLLGILTTQWGRPQAPDERDLWRLDLLARQAADLIEQERAEAALRESHERLKRVVETQTVGVMFWDLSTGCMVDANETFLALMGYSRSEVEARQLTWEKLTPPEYLEVSRAEIRKLLATGRVGPYEKEYFRKDGTRRWLLFAGSSLGHGECVVFCVDISDRKKAEAALRQANERLTYHVQNTPLAVVEFDAELKVCAWSEGAERMFGWKAAEVLGRPIGEIGWICEEDRGKAEQVSAGLASGQATRSVSPNRNLRKDGQVIWCEWYNSSITDGSGKMQSTLSLVLDVTKRKEAEAVLARDKEQLERLVAERTAALRELVGELEHFSYSITHDMRAPLRAIIGFAEVAKELCAECPQQEQKLCLDRIQTATKRMDLLITDALNYSKAVRSELPLAPVDVGRLLRGMVDTYPELQVAQGGIRIEPELPLVMGNEAGLTQCFSNLLVNAVKFAKPGEASEVRVWGQALGDGDGWVRIWVEDRGIGIGPKMLPRVFHMFARGASQQAGTGIGLALVRKVVERMGGRVGVESEEGRGSRFWVELRSGDVRGRAGIGTLDRPGAVA